MAHDRISRAAALFAVAVGAVVVAGWATATTQPTSLAPGLPSMKVNTALALVALGAGVLAAPRAAVVARLAGVLVALLGATVVLEYLVGPVGIDMLLFADTGTHPGRPSPDTALALVALGGALAFAPSRSPWALRAYFACSAAAAAIVVIACVGYVYRVDYLRAVSGTTGMAIHTLVALVVMTLALVRLRPAAGVAAWLAGPVRAPGAAARLLVPGAVVVPLALGLVKLLAEVAFGVDERVATGSVVLAMIAIALVLRSLALRTIADAHARLERSERAARDSEAQLQALLDHAPMPMSLRGLDGRFRIINRHAAAVMGRTPQELLALPLDELIAPAARERLAREEAAVRERGNALTFELRAPAGDGEPRDWLVTKYPVGDGDGRLAGIGGISLDITDRKRAEAQLAEAEERFRRAFEHSPIGMAIVDAGGRYVRVNAALAQITGYGAERLLSMRFSDVTHPDDVAGDEEVMLAFAGGEEEERPPREKRYVRASGEIVWVSVHSTVLTRDADGRPILLLGQIQDVTARRELEQRLRNLAVHDPLTGALNRRGFERALQRQLARVGRDGDGGALLLIDIDNFKAINDTHGHLAGDEAIATVAGILRGRLRESDELARIGGDEYAVLLAEGDATSAQTVAAALVREVRERTSAELPVTVSVGFAALHAGLQDPSGALAEADAALYVAKRHGRDCCAGHVERPAAAR